MGTFNDPNQFAYFHLYDDSGAFYGIPAEGRVIQSRHDCVLGNVFLGVLLIGKAKSTGMFVGLLAFFVILHGSFSGKDARTQSIKNSGGSAGQLL